MTETHKQPYKFIYYTGSVAYGIEPSKGTFLTPEVFQCDKGWLWHVPDWADLRDGQGCETFYLVTKSDWATWTSEDKMVPLGKEVYQTHGGVVWLPSDSEHRPL